MDPLTLLTKYEGEVATHPRFHVPSVRYSGNAASSLLGVPSPNNFDRYSDDPLYRPKNYINKIAGSQHFLILSTNIKVTTSGATAGSALTRAAHHKPDKLCLFPGFFIAAN
jgi:hypothetical protein